MLVLANSSLQADDRDSATADFLKIDPSSASAGFGSAYVARPSSSLGTYFNPAGLARLRRSQALYSQTDLFAGIDYQYLSYTSPLDLGSLDDLTLNGNMGIDLTALDFSQQNRTRVNPSSNPVTGLGSFGAEDMAASMTYGWSLHDKLDFGGSLKYVESTIANFSDETLTGNFGFQYHPKIPGLTLGLAGKNLFGDLALNQKADPLPSQVEGGLYYKRELDDGQHTIHVGTALSSNSGGEEFSSVGLEYEYYQRGFIRVGHKGLQEADDGFTFGVGLHYRNIKIDYAFVPFGNLGDLQRFSLAYQFGDTPSKKQRDDESKRSQDRSRINGASKRNDQKDKKQAYEGETKRNQERKSQSSPSVRRAVQYYNEGSYRQARNQLRSIMEIRPNHINALLWLGKIEFELGNNQKAMNQFEQVLELEPKNSMAHQNLKIIRSHLKNKRKTRKE